MRSRRSYVPGRGAIFRRSVAPTVDYFTLRALAAEWAKSLPGLRVAEAFSQSRNECRIALEGEGGAWTVCALCEGPRPLFWRAEGGGRARRNTASLFESAAGGAVAAVRVAERDRFLSLDLDDGSAFVFLLFGPRPNVLLVRTDGAVAEAFLSDADWEGQPAPRPQPAPRVATFEAFAARWKADRKTTAQAFTSALPLFDRALAAEAARRAGLDPAAPPPLDEGALRALLDAARSLEVELEQPRPRIYMRGRRPEALTLVPLTSPPSDWREEAFETVDAAARVWAQRTLAARRFLLTYRPAEAALAAAADRLARRADAMADELQKPSRAHRYERWAHVLMAQAAGEGPGQERVVLPDVMGDGTPVEIPLEEALSAVENAERYYGRARQARQARAHAESRWASVLADAERAADLLNRLRALDRYDDLARFLDEEREALARFLRPEAVGEEALPYRRFVLPGGWEARVGKNARSNAELTTRHAGPHDLWLHARGVPGSHVVLRRPNRTATPDRRVVEAAASLAAHFSQAKTQALVPVQMTERKFVRPIKGGAPGAVRVEREEVLMVEPKLPG